MRPQLFDFEFPPRISHWAQHEQLHTGSEAVRNVCINLSRNLAVTALRFHHAGQRNEFAACRVWVPRLSRFLRGLGILSVSHAPTR
jgi:hypothetical protein